MRNVLVLKHVPQEGPGTVGARLQENGAVCTVVELGHGETCPATLDGYHGLVVMGGPMNVYEEARYLFLADEDRMIQLALDKKVPFLGICLGAQLLAKAAGARVYCAPEMEIGWQAVSLTPAGRVDPLFAGVGRGLTVFQWHGDTFDVPVGGQLLATADACPAQALKVGINAYGLQFHVETDAEMINAWLADATLGNGRQQAIRRGTAKHAAGLQQVAETMTDNFLHLCKEEGT
jgi:GMP synthase-like glutamine amidotransferase